MMIALQVLLFFRGVKRMLWLMSSTRRRTPSIQPKESASARVMDGFAGVFLVETDQELGGQGVFLRQPLAGIGRRFEKVRWHR
jgi:hypothetical protein